MPALRSIACAVLLVTVACACAPGGSQPPATLTPPTPDRRVAEPHRPALPAGPRELAMSDGVVLHVEVAGQGPPCLYVHGGPGQGAQSFQRMRGDRLESTLTMIYVDQRGSGRSADATDYRLDRVVADLDEVRAALGHDKVYLLAHSFGGVLALRYAELYPDRVLGLVAANTSLWLPASLRAQIAYIRAQIGDPSAPPDTAPPDTAPLAELEADYLRAREQLNEHLNRTSKYVPVLAADVQTLRIMREVDADPPRNRAFGRYITTNRQASAEYHADFTPRTEAVRAPVLVITGDRDHAIGPDHFRLFRFPNQAVRHIDGSHLLYYENSDEFVATVRQWILATEAARSSAAPRRSSTARPAQRLRSRA